MKINRLRLLGFKSFVEPTELIIERGLTGVVGPNGCGKSNLLEALRWVMGETSHKSMRAAAMDDVIFSGTTQRPARNSAEVTMFIDNQERRAPAEFNDRDVIEITRRIEREAGSGYRINGKEARARDVKLLFEDAATGARSPALVRQGQIGEIVNSKPEARRRILEDAAGIAGLHSRRHEAELRLKAAESNLARLTDILGGLNSQIESLKRQARQARRYKEISGEIRKQEALLLHLSWVDAQAQVDAEEHNLTQSLYRLGLATEAEAKALREESELAETMQPLRDAEAARGAAAGRLKIEADNLEREAKRAAGRQSELEARAAQLAHDMARESSLIAEARETLTALSAESEAIGLAEADAGIKEDQARVALDEAETALEAAETRLAAITQTAAETRAKTRTLEMQRTERAHAAGKLERQITALEAQAREIAARAPDVAKLTSTADVGKRLAADLGRIEAETATAEDRTRAAASLTKTRRQEAAAARLAANALTTERDTLAKLLVPMRDSGVPAILDQLRVAPGYEAALAASLGDDLDAPASEDELVHWRLIEAQTTDAALPFDAEPLIHHVECPPELARRLRQIGIVPRSDGARLQRHLKPGQRLVSREGDLWRWDGFVAAADGTTAAAQRLAERNRLSVIEYEETLTRETADLLADAERAAADAQAEAEAEELRLRQLWRATQSELSETREALTSIERAARETENRLAAVADARVRAADDLADALTKQSEAEAEFRALADSTSIEDDLLSAQLTAQHCRQAVSDIRTALASLQRDRKMRADRVATISGDIARWSVRISGAEQQIATLNNRRTEAETELAVLTELPERVEQQRQALMTRLADAQRRRQDAADLLATAETALRTATQSVRAAQGAVAQEREARARIEAKLESARTKRQDEARRIRESLDVVPEGCLALAEMKQGTALPQLIEVDRTLIRLKSDRERLGGVNLQADEELTILSEQFSSMDRERGDVEQAIAKLRSAIQQLNREAKKRLGDAFEIVNGHFQRLFTTLFSGGEARLEMIESEEDPLEGGLEIIAKPPGKKPATLSLLSGGEQTLTALSLIFAVFLTNPSPICVLDEVDAPLDDANVDRFCTLMEKMAGETATRFLVITHHPMTMTRMNRLFGVTMAERGISQLVSVDLELAQSFSGHAQSGAA